jgi:processive 1,2-diacylglycerol beta-glucosyltransferase
VASRPARIQIVSASIGEGHDLPARVLADGLRRAQPGCEVEIVDFLAVVGPFLRNAIGSGSNFHTEFGNRVWDIQHRWIMGPLRRPVQVGGRLLSGRHLLREARRFRPDVIVATYPGASEVLGQLRQRGELEAPVVSAITDLASLWGWAQPGVDLHLITHPESAPEVRSIAPHSRIVAVRGLTDPSFYAPLEMHDARRQLGLEPAGQLITVSGGGWAVGDLEGAAEVALRTPGVRVICLCGRNDDVRAAVERRFASEPRVEAWGFTERMGELLAASDVLIHSTAGLTVLEALMRGTRVISYGWGIAHIRLNNIAYERFGLARVASTPDQLERALKAALTEPRTPDLRYLEFPEAAAEVLALAG